MNSADIVIVGGAYGEECAFPRRQVYRGSGTRAAYLLSSLGLDVSFVSYAGPSMQSVLNSLSKKVGFHLQVEKKSEDIWFRYRHPLSKPTIQPAQYSQLTFSKTIHCDNALVYGMLESRPVVHAKKAVFDPQDGAKAMFFESNGSTCDQLAIVASYSEAKALSGLTEPTEMARELIRKQNVRVVVIKCGPQGALVHSDDRFQWVRPFVTRSVYKIGSGDIFSAVFAHAWMYKNAAPVECALFASRMTAKYVETGIDGISVEDLKAILEDVEQEPCSLVSNSPRNIPESPIYLAGPFFDTAQQWIVDEVREALIDMGFKVFSPIHDVGEGPAHEIAQADLAGLEKCSLVLAILNGMDAGTLFEIGYARAKDIPVIAVAETMKETDMTMITGSGCELVHDLTTAVYRACWRMMGDV